jgi:hypothetical protein
MPTVAPESFRRQLHQDLGETRVAVIEHADMTEPRHGLENGCEAVHGNQGCWAGGFSSPIDLGRDAIVIGPEYLPNARELVVRSGRYFLALALTSPTPPDED